MKTTKTCKQRGYAKDKKKGEPEKEPLLKPSGGTLLKGSKVKGISKRDNKGEVNKNIYFVVKCRTPASRSRPLLWSGQGGLEEGSDELSGKKHLINF